jgi:transcriptional regulator with XRE-family HTH domain
MNAGERQRETRWDDDAFRERVTKLAADRGLTIAAVCRAAGTSGSYFAKPAGRSGRSIEALLRIARTLDVSLSSWAAPKRNVTKSNPQM